MFKKLAQVAFVALTGMISVAPVFAQDSVSQIDSEHSTARLYLASSKKSKRQCKRWCRAYSRCGQAERRQLRNPRF